MNNNPKGEGEGARPFPFLNGGETMIIQDLLDEANILADESFDDDTMVKFYNQCTTDINIRTGAIFPSITVEDVNKPPALPEKWARSLYVPFMAGRIKQQDSSQFEYTDLYSQYEQAFGMFLASYVIPDQYIDKTNWDSVQVLFASSAIRDTDYWYSPVISGLSKSFKVTNTLGVEIEVAVETSMDNGASWEPAVVLNSDQDTGTTSFYEALTSPTQGLLWRLRVKASMLPVNGTLDAWVIAPQEESSIYCNPSYPPFMTRW